MKPFSIYFMLMLTAFFINSVQAMTVIDGQEWRQLTETTNISWNQVADICATDGTTACNGSIGSIDFNSWIWAKPEQVGDMFSVITPHPGGIASFRESNPTWAENVFTNYFDPTKIFTTTTDGLEVIGIAAGQSPGDEGFMAATPRIFYNISANIGLANSQSASLNFDDQSTTYGIWLFRPASPVPLPTAWIFFLSSLFGLKIFRQKFS